MPLGRAFFLPDTSCSATDQKRLDLQANDVAVGIRTYRPSSGDIWENRRALKLLTDGRKEPKE